MGRIVIRRDDGSTVIASNGHESLRCSSIDLGCAPIRSTKNINASLADLRGCFKCQNERMSSTDEERRKRAQVAPRQDRESDLIQTDNTSWSIVILALKNLLFTLVVPGAVGVYVPLILSKSRTATTGLVFTLALLLFTIGGSIYAWCVFDFASFGRGTPLPVCGELLIPGGN